MVIYDIAGLEIGNDEELTRAINKIYDKGRRINCLIVNPKQLEFIGDCYEVYGNSIKDEEGEIKQSLYFNPGWNEMELRLEDEA